MRFLCKWTDFNGGAIHPTCVDVTLYISSPVYVSPITVRSHAFLTSENEPLHQGLEFSRLCDSLGGYARGLFWKTYRDPSGAAESQDAIVKFMIDATRDCCVATLTAPIGMETSPHYNLRWHEVHVDCIRGRLCYLREEEPENPALVVVDARRGPYD